MEVPRLSEETAEYLVNDTLLWGSWARPASELPALSSGVSALFWQADSQWRLQEKNTDELLMTVSCFHECPKFP